MTADPRMLAFVAEHNWGVLATSSPTGGRSCPTSATPTTPRPSLFRISVTADRAKTRNLRADPRVTLHVASKDFWTWVAVEGTAELTPGGRRPATTPRSKNSSRTTAAINGEHENWDEYRAAMVADRRLVVRFLPEHTYGQLRG